MPRDKKYWQRRFGSQSPATPYQHHIDLRGTDDLDDEGLAFFLANVKGVNMLDLNETDITNKGIQLLTDLEYVTELRAKGCNLDDSCAKDLNKITSLEFLHLKNTHITVQGLLQLKDLVHLKTLLFSANDVDGIKQEMLQLKTAHPACEFVIDGKAYYFNSIDLFIHALQEQPCQYRLKLKNDSSVAGWSNWLSKTGANGIEAELQGAYGLDEVEWVEIDPIEKIKATDGPDTDRDHSAAILSLLNQLEFPFMVTDSIISVYLVQKEDA